MYLRILQELRYYDLVKDLLALPVILYKNFQSTLKNDGKYGEFLVSSFLLYKLYYLLLITSYSWELNFCLMFIHSNCVGIVFPWLAIQERKRTWMVLSYNVVRIQQSWNFSRHLANFFLVLRELLALRFEINSAYYISQASLSRFQVAFLNQQWYIIDYVKLFLDSIYCDSIVHHFYQKVLTNQTLYCV